MGAVHRRLPNLAAKPARNRTTELRRALDLPPERMPLFDWWRFVVEGFGNCGVREYVLGVPLPVWSALFFCAVLLLVWGMLFKMRRQNG